MSFHSYQSCGACSGGAKPATRYVMEALIAKYPYIRSMGIYSCRNVGGTSTRSIHSCGRAGDPGIPTLSGGKADTSRGHPPLRDLIDNAGPLGIHGLIYDRVRYDARSPRGRYYGGVHPHNDHIHFEQTDWHSRNLSRAQVFSILGVGETEEDDMLGFNIGPMGADSIRNDRALTLQLMLLDRGQELPEWGADGAAGDETRTAYAAWQQAEGITGEDGVVGPKSYASLFAPKRGLRGPRGFKGDQGDKGDRGPTGRAGRDGADGTLTVRGAKEL